jgi:putative ATP-binding cassette transporter
MLEILKVISFLLRTSRQIRLARLTTYAAVAAGLLSGVGQTTLLALVNAGLSNPSNRRLVLSFATLCVLVPASRFTSQVLLNLLGARAVFAVRMRLCRSILSTPLRRLEEIGSHRLLACLTDDVTSLTNALILIPALSMHVSIVLACLGYMGLLSGRLFLLVLGTMLIGMFTYNLPLGRARFYLTRLRSRTDTLFKHLRGVVHGAKELQLHQERQQGFLDSVLTPTAEAIRSDTFLGNTIFTAATVWGNLFFFIIIGILVFSRPFGVDVRMLSGFTLALLYMLTPLEVLFQALPILGRAAAAAAKLERLGLELGSQTAEKGPPAAPAPPPAWRTLQLVRVTHAYHGEDGQTGFSIGPIDLTFRAGEMIFLIGGNGSGKTSLAKIIVGLYQPESGEIQLDGRSIGAEDGQRYRQMFSAVFSDFYLFEELTGIADEGAEEKAQRYLERLELDRKVTIAGGALSTLDLSQGQRKRLALLAAYLEDRPIYFFDEWAADQDPQFKAIFYFEILPELKARGKTVFVISHDDQYYEVADRLIKLNYGQVEWDRPGAQAAEVAGGLFR